MSVHQVFYSLQHVLVAQEEKIAVSDFSQHFAAEVSRDLAQNFIIWCIYRCDVQVGQLVHNDASIR